MCWSSRHDTLPSRWKKGPFISIKGRWQNVQHTALQIEANQIMKHRRVESQIEKRGVQCETICKVGIAWLMLIPSSSEENLVDLI